ncbi:zinc finger protein 182-like isoform X2 [Rhopilema esculentum]|uniref:zinc finger protein 182-like isoform X2 n=1 Tax=Rhopilema esculentum TaxID=499914 RepID=UPI0031DFDBA9
MAASSTVEQQNAIDANSNSIGLEFDEKLQRQDSLKDEDLNILKEKLDILPEKIRKKIKELEDDFQEGDLTEKGYKRRLKLLVAPHLEKIQSVSNDAVVELYEPNLNALPKFAVEQLEELERELKEEEITLKGYKRKREKILAPFMLKEPPFSSLPKGIQNELNELAQDFKDGDLTEKGFKKKRTKIITPYLVKANSWSSLVNILPNRNSVLTVFVPSQEKQKDDSDQAIGIQIMNGNEKIFKCQLCNEVFKQAQSFSGHCRLHRNNKSKAFKCTICKATYTTRSHLKFHMYKHTGNYPFNCEYCGKGFAGRSQYRYHALRHSGQSPYICKDCGGRFWKKRNLEVHCSKHRCDDAPAGLQKCAHCLAMFEDLEDLQTHMYEHDDEVQENVKATQATMVQRTQNKNSEANNDESMESEEEEIPDDDDDEANDDVESTAKDLPGENMGSVAVAEP